MLWKSLVHDIHNINSSLSKGGVAYKWDCSQTLIHEHDTLHLTYEHGVDTHSRCVQFQYIYIYIYDTFVPKILQ